jgi:hypothetical protein
MTLDQRAAPSPAAAPDISHLPDVAPTPRRWMLLYVLLASAVPIAYASITHHIWEDYFITFRHSVNLVEGRGLTFNPPQRVHGFTSAINVMLPALFYWITGQHGYVTALQLFRAASLVAAVLGGWFTLRWMLRDPGRDRLSPLVFILLFITEAKSVAYTMNGQECGFMICFLSLALAVAYRGIRRHWTLMSLAWAGLLYTRPDAPVYIAAIALTCLVFAARRRETVGAIMKAGILTAAAYLPWFIAMWTYYGSPIPHTIVAKSGFGTLNGMYPEKILVQWLAMFPQQAIAVFLPIYSGFGGWPDWLLVPFGAIAALFAAGYWLVPSRDRGGRMASLMFCLSVAYFTTVGISGIVYPWYLPSAAVFAVIAIARGVPEVFSRLVPRTLLPARLVQGAIVLMAALLLCATTWQIRIQQRVIEDQTRTAVGLYLRDAVPVGQRVYLEPVGYIGYFSNAIILDWPGLVTPEVERLHHERKLGQMNMIKALKPEWLVLRQAEYNNAARFQEVQEHYELVRSFDSRPALAAYSYIPGRGYLDVDAVFHVLRRKQDEPATSLPSRSE